MKDANAYLNHAGLAPVKVLRPARLVAGAALSGLRAICYHAGPVGRQDIYMKGRNVSGVLDRLAQNVRAYWHEFLQWRAVRTPSAAPWWAADDWPRESFHHGASGPQPRSSPLPHSAELADAYRVLDLPFGTPLAAVSDRWKTYLKRCHPDRFHNDPKRLADATELTRQLNAAHDRIEAAWKNASRTD